MLGPHHTSSRHLKSCSAVMTTWGQSGWDRQMFQFSHLNSTQEGSLSDKILHRFVYTLLSFPHPPCSRGNRTRNRFEFGNIFINSEIPGHLGNMILANQFRSQISLRIDSPLRMKQCRPPSLSGTVGCERGKMEVGGHCVVLNWL